MFESAGVFATVWPLVDSFTIINIVLKLTLILDPTPVPIYSLPILPIKAILALIFGTIRPRLHPLPRELPLVKTANIFGTIGPLVRAFSLEFVILETAYVYGAALFDVDPGSVLAILFELSDIHGAVRPAVDAFTFEFAFVEPANIFASVFPGIRAFSVLFQVFEGFRHIVAGVQGASARFAAHFQDWIRPAIIFREPADPCFLEIYAHNWCSWCSFLHHFHRILFLSHILNNRH